MTTNIQVRVLCRKVKFNKTAVTTLLCDIINHTPYPSWSCSLQLGGLASIRQLNHVYRHKDRATDVLSFPFHQVNKRIYLFIIMIIINQCNYIC
jgi:ssRNA-specific RNase YbeY (16S rRNA maturation enzyme)